MTAIFSHLQIFSTKFVLFSFILYRFIYRFLHQTRISSERYYVEMNVKCVLCIRFECAQRNIDYTHTRYLHVKLFVDLKTFLSSSVCVCV